MNGMKKRRGIWLSWLVSGWMILGLASCDTSAELTFEDEQVTELVPQGLVSDKCMHLEEETEADAVFRFSIMTSFNAHLTPGERYSALGQPLMPGQNFQPENVTFSNSWFFVANTASEDKTCNNEAECPVGASCLSAAEMGLDQYYYARAGKFCVYPTEIEIVAVPQFTHYQTQVLPGNDHVFTDNAQGRTIAFMMDNSASLDGSDLTGIPDSQTATDPWQYRKVGLNQFMDGLAMTSDTKPKYEFSAHFANGTGVQGVYDISPAWMRTEAVWNASVMDKYPSPSGHSPIWETAIAAIQKIQDKSTASYTHTMIAFTDGVPNEGTDESFTEFSRLMKVSQNTSLSWLDLETNAQQPDTRYAKMTDLGCGSYYLFDNPAQIPSIMRQLALNTESHWDVAIKYSADLPSGTLYRLATDIMVKVGNSAVAYSAHRTNDTQNETMDNRLVLSK